MSHRGLLFAVSFGLLMTWTDADGTVTRRVPAPGGPVLTNGWADGVDRPIVDGPALLETYCHSCHGTERQKGRVRFDGLGARPNEEQSELLRRAQEALQVGDMPPEKAPQPTESERALLLAWLKAQLDADSDAALEDKLRQPHYGNVVDHDALFSGELQGPASTPARRWLVSPQIFHERVMGVFKLEGRDRDGKKHGSFAGVTNPFLLPEHSGVRDYAHGVLDGGDLLVMLGNAKWIAARQVAMARMLVGGRDAVTFENPKDRWVPRQLPASYEAFGAMLQGEGEPSREVMAAAIREQFDCVLRREPTAAETDRYLTLLEGAVASSDCETGLQQMLFAVLLESEFLYRLEFGEGEADAHGRRMLSPREAAFAISYALGDREPDAALVEAAATGRLATRDDVEREVRRLLDDTQYYRGQVDPALNGKHYKSNETSHPKVVRFFREFFGYPGSMKVFKDGKRAEARYSNPGRGTSATPGWLTYEADKIVTWHVEKDVGVFEALLGSDQFFVYHNMDNEAGVQLLAEWRGVYERLRDTAWRTDAESVLTEHLEFLQQQPSMRIKDASRPGELVNFMHYFEETFGQGRNPFTRYPWSHGYTYHHAPFYGLPPTPRIGRYGSWKSSKFNDKLEAVEFWDYPAEQPFTLERRKGILTHPAWLIAHSTNFHADPIRRGRWIREKLLAGRVPDVPITVDAQVPEDPHRTFRERVEEVTAPAECWTCHQHMNPLGLAFEMYDDFGRDRVEETLEHPDNLIKRGNGKTTFDEYPTAPVVTTGVLSGTGDPQLDGEVDDALEMVARLVESSRVRQSIIRHAFRFYMGRNERRSDAPTLMDADRAYVESGGSFRAVIVSLLTSDSFLYRT